jgi:hypothetical protein
LLFFCGEFITISSLLTETISAVACPIFTVRPALSELTGKPVPLIVIGSPPVEVHFLGETYEIVIGIFLAVVEETSAKPAPEMNTLGL